MRSAFSLAVAGVVIAAVATGCTIAAVAGSGGTVAFVVGACAVVALLAFISFDSARRGRSVPGWLLLTLFLAPIGLPAFAFFAISDRSKGRPGIEAGWPAVARWCTVGAIALAVAASYLALAHLTVASFSSPTGSVSGDCSNALSVSLGDRDGLPAGLDSTNASGETQTLNGAFSQAVSSVDAQCTAKASRRMTAAAIALAGAFGLGLVGTASGRRGGPATYMAENHHETISRRS